MNRIDICFRCVRYRMLDELKSRTLLGDRCGLQFLWEICDSGFSGVEDAKF